MVFIHMRKVWHLLRANFFDMRAARVEGAAFRQVCQGGWAAGHTVAHTFITEFGQRVDQVLGIGMQRLGKHLLCGSPFNDYLSLHDSYLVCAVYLYAHIRLY